MFSLFLFLFIFSLIALAKELAFSDLHGLIPNLLSINIIRDKLQGIGCNRIYLAPPNVVILSFLIAYI